MLYLETKRKCNRYPSGKLEQFCTNLSVAPTYVLRKLRIYFVLCLNLVQQFALTLSPVGELLQNDSNYEIVIICIRIISIIPINCLKIFDSKKDS